MFTFSKFGILQNSSTLRSNSKKFNSKNLFTKAFYELDITIWPWKLFVSKNPKSRKHLLTRFFLSPIFKAESCAYCKCTVTNGTHFLILIPIISFQYGNVLIHTEVSLIFAFMSAYTISTIMLSFFLSTLFNRANIAAAAGGIIFFCIYLPYSFMVVWESKITHSIRIATSLLSNVAFGFGCAYLAHYEESGEGATWSNIWTSPLLGKLVFNDSASIWISSQAKQTLYN